jgi:acyl-coenzyme A synthetase/AMP-(fatty) acid ligase
VIGGENLPAETLRFWRQAAPAMRLINEYGPTETVVGCSFHEVTPADPGVGPVPIGRPIANTEVYILDNDQRPVPQGVTGELCVGGAGVARGYLNRAALTAERFIDDPFSRRPDARLYRTGDLARRRKDGVLEFLGRVDSQVKIRGYRIEPGEIEAALADHPAVQTSAVIVREDVPGDRYLAAYVVLRAGTPIGPAGFLEYLRTRLPEFMRPRYVCMLDTLPLTHNGKIDREALPAPEPRAFVPDPRGIPRSASEALVLRTFQEVLGRPDLGIFDDFFQAGGYSLSAARLLSELHSAAGCRVPLRGLFENPTAAGLAALLDGIACITPAPSMSPSRGAWEDVEV